MGGSWMFFDILEMIRGVSIGVSDFSLQFCNYFLFFILVGSQLLNCWWCR